MSVRERVNILLVDDQPGKLLSLQAILSDLNENLITAGSADAALTLLLEKEIAIVLVDVCMPRMDGFEMAQLIREHPRFQRTAIIFISAVHLTDDDRLRGYGLGAVDYIPVPIVPQVLRAKVAIFADLFRKTDQLQRVNAELKERVAELDRSNERLRFADRMATIGTLAAGLGHDMGNLLLPVRMRLDTLDACELPDSAREDVAAIRTGTEYLRRLATSLRMLSVDPQNLASGQGETRAFEWWQETEGMIRNGVPRTVTLSAEIPADLPVMRIDKAAITQIAFNLVQNAGDALKGRTDGHIKIIAEASHDRSRVVISVVDNGPGMSEEAQRRCLEPFFTTKTREVSTGLGLTLVAGLLKRANATIEIDSRLGVGTTFRMGIEAAVPPQCQDPQRAPRRGVAVVTLSDRWLLAHVRAVLDSLEYEVRCDGGPQHADLWILDQCDAQARQAIDRFTASDPQRRVMIFGGIRGDEPASDRVVFLEGKIKPSLLRSRMCDVLRVHENGAGKTYP